MWYQQSNGEWNVSAHDQAPPPPAGEQTGPEVGQVTHSVCQPGLSRRVNSERLSSWVCTDSAAAALDFI